jgi:hypothetical protein
MVLGLALLGPGVWTAGAVTNTFNQGEPTFVQTTINNMTPGDTEVFNDSGTYNATVVTIWTNYGKIFFNGTIWVDKIVDTGSDSTRCTFRIDGVQNHLQRLSGLTVNPGAMPQNSGEAGILFLRSGNMIRVDHVAIHSDRYINVVANDVFGVIDHSDLSPATGSFIQPGRFRHDNFLVPNGKTDGNGDYSWINPAMWGSSNFFFIEDCVTTNSSGSTGLGFDAYGGARYEIRYSTLRRMIIGGHGTETTQRERGTRARIMHNNLIIHNAGDSEAGHARSGTYLFYSNTVWNVNNAIQKTIPYRLNTPTTPWGFANGVTNWDHNDPANPYVSGTVTSGSLFSLTDNTKSWTAHQWQGYSLWDPTQDTAKLILDNTATTLTLDPSDDAVGRNLTPAPGDSYQIGKVMAVLDGPFMGAGSLMSNTPPVINGIAQWPQQVVEPAYQWSNSFNGTVTTTQITDGGFIQQYTNNVHFFNNVQAPSFTDYPYPHPLIEEAQTDPQITQQPANATVGIGQSAPFTVSATGTAPIHYFWTFNGSAVGSDSSSYTRANCQLVDNNGSVSCLVSNQISSVQSSTATLTVTNNPAPASNFRVTNKATIGTLRTGP